MQEPIVVRSGIDVFTKAAVATDGALRAVKMGRHDHGNKAGYSTKYYVALKDCTFQGAISLITFPDYPDACFIDFLSVAAESGSAVRSKLLNTTAEYKTVLVDQATAPVLVSNKDYRLLDNGVFVRSAGNVTKEEVNKLCQTYKERVSSLFSPPSLSQNSIDCM